MEVNWGYSGNLLGVPQPPKNEILAAFNYSKLFQTLDFFIINILGLFWGQFTNRDYIFFFSISE